MRLIDADEVLKRWGLKFYAMGGDRLGPNGDDIHFYINGLLNEIQNAPTVDTYTEDDVQYAIKEGHQVGYEMAKAKYDRPQGGEWIPVSERLPEDMQKVLVWFEYYRYGDYNCMYQTYGFGYVCDGKWSPFINGETGWQDARIIAWQSLPKAYKEAENDV